MKNVKLLIGTTTILFASAFTLINSINWKVKNDYAIKCSVGKDGSLFKGLKATISFDEEHPEKSKIIASIDARTINTGNDMMNTHAKEKEALYTAKYPEITFVSTVIKKIGTTGKYEATGNLTLKGVTKEIKFPFSFDSKKNMMDRFPLVTKETFYGTITIAPRDFNITRQGTPETVTIDLTLPVTQ